MVLKSVLVVIAVSRADPSRTRRLFNEYSDAHILEKKNLPDPSVDVPK